MDVSFDTGRLQKKKESTDGGLAALVMVKAAMGLIPNTCITGRKKECWHIELGMWLRMLPQLTISQQTNHIVGTPVTNYVTHIAV